MVSLQKIGNNYNTNILELVSKSTDTKPTNATGGISNTRISNGSTLFQMDDGKVYLFDEDGDVWVEV